MRVKEKVLILCYKQYSFYSDYTYCCTGWEKGDYSHWSLNKRNLTVKITHMTKDKMACDLMVHADSGGAYDELFYDLCCQAEDIINFNETVEKFLSE